MPDQGPAFQLDIVSDTICPWCYIGKRHLEAALPVLAAEGLGFEVTWRPYQLNPGMPREGVERREYRVRKFGSWERSQAMDAQVAAAGAAAGLDFRFDLMPRTPNTLASHALMRLAHETGGAGMQDRLAELMFIAYFTAGQDIGDPGTLADLAVKAGMDEAAARRTVADPEAIAAVAREEAQACRLGLNGVPSFVLNGHLLFSGAQPSGEMVRMLREACRILARHAAVV